MAKLIVVFRNKILQEIKLAKETVRIGRDSDNEIQIDNPGVSRFHAEVYRQGYPFYIEDMKSTNGTYINGKRVSRYPLSVGDEVVISKHILKLTDSSEPVSPHVASNDDLHQVVQGATVQVDVSNLDELVKQKQSR